MSNKPIIQELIDLETDGPRVSIYMPSVRAGAEVRQNPIRFKNRLRDARERLESRAIESSAIDAMLAPAQARFDDDEFWNHQREGLALFLADGFSREVPLSHDPGEVTVVGDRFHLRPLLARDAGDRRFHVLALSQNQVHLYVGTRDRLEPMSVEDLPQSLEDALGSELTNQHLNHHSADSGDPAIFHAQGRGKDDEDAELAKFCRIVDEAVVGVADRDAPLVLAGVEHVVGTYRAVSRHPCLAEESVAGNPEQMDDGELRDAAWACLEPERRARRDEAVERFASAEANDKALSEIPQIVIAALDGRIDTLLFADDAEAVWGEVDVQQRQVATGGNDGKAGEDLLDRAVVEAFSTGAALVPLDRKHMPQGAQAVAITRY